MSKFYNAKNLELFRQTLETQNLDGFLVPLTDAFQNEYIPDHARFLEWLCNFQGSAGMLLVTKQQAVLFTDGRYLLQARAQTDPQIFTVEDLTSLNLSTWMERNLKPKTIIGFDPWLHTVRQIETWQQQLRPLKITLHPVLPNPLESLWKNDRPVPMIRPAFAHPEEYAGQSSKEKRQAIATILQTEKMEAVFLNAADSICWLLNIRGEDIPNTPVVLSYALLYKNGSVDWFVDLAKITPDLTAILDKDIRIHALSELETFIPSNLSKRHTIGLDPNTTPFRVQQILRDGKQYIHFLSDPCVLPKACKNATEIEAMRQTHIRDGAVVTTYLHWLSEQPLRDLTEILASNHLDALRRKDPLLWDLSFPTISAIDAHAAMPHYRAMPETDTPFKKGSIYLVDSGGQYKDGGTTDITRTISVGNKVTSHQQEAYTRVLKGKIALFQTKFPAGTTGAQLDALARQYLWQMGIDFDHGTGHGVGSFLNVHEEPQRISKRSSPVALQPGMVLSNEPGYYKAKAFGVRLENVMVVMPCTDATDKPFLQFENLTWAPYDPTLIQKEMLSPEEKKWLHWYHQETLKYLSPLLGPAPRAWLEGIVERFKAL